MRNDATHAGELSAGSITVTVTGAGSTWLPSSALDIGEAGNGTLNVADGGSVTSTSGWLGYLNGGTLDVNGNVIWLGTTTGAAFNFIDGTLRDVSEYNTDLNQQGGRLEIGSSPGVMTITGDYNQAASATLEIELFGDGGVAGVDFDQLVADGIATLAGTIDVLVDNPYSPAFGQTWDVLTADTITTDTTFSLAPEPGFLFDWEVLTNGGGDDTLRLTLQIIPEPATGIMVMLLTLTLGLIGRRRHMSQPN